MLSKLFRPSSRLTGDSHYRADVDGLRAVAVLSVILFHLDLAGFGGGYVGVDVFFVMSGYLITQIIRSELPQNKFSFARFYERRIRRIVPSLFVTLGLSSIAAGLMFTTYDLVKFADSMVASLLFVANIFFYNQSGYFDSFLDDKPLMHLWSLGVEIQFYILWPIILVYLLRTMTQKGAALSIAALGALSLVVSIALATNDPLAGFYFVPTRMFEFFLGGAVLWFSSPSGKVRGKFLAELFFMVGLGMVAVSIATFTTTTPFPSYYALLPCVGTALIIYSGGSARLSILLSNRVMAYLGRISYELYLFHWPVVVFYKYITFTEITALDQIIMSVLTLLLSAATYHGISYRMRYGFSRTTALRQNFMIGLLVVCVALMGLAIWMHKSGGWPNRIRNEAHLFTQNPGEFHKTNFGGVGYDENKLAVVGDPNVAPQFIMIGDSFTAQYAIGLSEFLAAHKKSAYLFHISGCLIMPHVTAQIAGIPKPTCDTAYAQVQQFLLNNKLPVVQAQSWSSFKESLVMRGGNKLTFAKDTNDGYYQFIIESIEQMRVALGARRYLFVGISPGIREQKSLIHCFDIPSYIPVKCSADVAEKEEERLNGQEFNLAAAKYVQSHPEVTFINPRNAVCQKELCYAIKDSKIFYSDYSHFTKEGAAEVLTHYQDLLLSLHP